MSSLFVVVLFRGWRQLRVVTARNHLLGNNRQALALLSSSLNNNNNCLATTLATNQQQIWRRDIHVTSPPMRKRRKTAEERKSPRIIEFSPKKAKRNDDEKNKDGGGKNKDGGDKNKNGGDKNKNGGGKIKDGGGKIKDGGGKIKDGADKNKDGGDKIKDGGGKIKDGGGKNKDGGDKIKDGGGKIKDGDDRNKNGGHLDNRVVDVVRRPPAADSQLRPRPAVVAVMGHVDHGKTTLLDALRGTRHAATERGGITQYVRAFNVSLVGNNGMESVMTFLDTPGHAAFRAMRTRGTSVTDLVVLVVAADDGVMPQTCEAVRMARDAHVPMVVAINKIDAPRADVARTERMLLEVAGVQVESAGGDVQCVAVSALRRIHLDRLIECVATQTDLMSLRADPHGAVEAVVIESRIVAYDRRRKDGAGGGASGFRSCTVVVQRGTLRRGAILVAGRVICKVRDLRRPGSGTANGIGSGTASDIGSGTASGIGSGTASDIGSGTASGIGSGTASDIGSDRVDNVPPGYAADVDGWRDDLPAAGELAIEVASERRAREIVRYRADREAAARAASDAEAIAAKAERHRCEYRADLERRRRLGLARRRKSGGTAAEPRKADDGDGRPRLTVIVKADVDGTLEAILETLDTYRPPQSDVATPSLDIVAYGIGPVTETDVEMARTFRSVIYAFNVTVTERIRKMAADADAAAAKSGQEDGDAAVDIREHDVIYKLIDDVRAELNARVVPVETEDAIGEAIVLKRFELNESARRRRRTVAGCRCIDGTLKRTALYRLTRDGRTVYDGPLASMRHVKEEVETVKSGMECGLQLADDSVDVVEGDRIVCYAKRLVKPSIDWDPGF